jgi:hypothetical protein
VVSRCDGMGGQSGFSVSFAAGIRNKLT